MAGWSSTESYVHVGLCFYNVAHFMNYKYLHKI